MLLINTLAKKKYVEKDFYSHTKKSNSDIVYSLFDYCFYGFAIHKSSATVPVQ